MKHLSFYVYCPLFLYFFEPSPFLSLDIVVVILSKPKSLELFLQHQVSSLLRILYLDIDNCSSLITKFNLYPLFCKGINATHLRLTLAIRKMNAITRKISISMHVNIALNILCGITIFAISQVPFAQTLTSSQVIPASFVTKKITPVLLAPMAVLGNNVYVTWWTNNSGDWEVMFRASTDDGKTFGPIINLSNSSGVVSDNASIAASGNNVYVSWWERANQTINEPVMKVSIDNGKTFGPRIILNNSTIVAAIVGG
jgi:hypothetical protein